MLANHSDDSDLLTEQISATPSDPHAPDDYGVPLVPPVPPRAKRSNLPQGDGSATSAENASASPAEAAPTFFDGTYRPDTTVGSRRPAFRWPLGPRWRYIYNFALVALDVLMMLLACVLELLIRADVLRTVRLSVPGGVMPTLAVFCLVWVFCLAFMRSYVRHVMGEGYSLYARILSAAVLNFFALCSVAYLFGVPYPRWLVSSATAMAAAFTLVERWLMRRLLHRNRRMGEYNYSTLVIGSPEGIRSVIGKLTSQSGLAMGYAPIAVCPVEEIGEENDPDSPQHLISVPFEPQNDYERGLRVLPLNSRLPQTARHLGARIVLIADVLTRDSETMRTLALAVESLNMELAVTASVADIGGGRIHMRNNSAMPIMTASLPQYSLPIRFMKRAVDIAGSLVALIPGSIIMAITAIFIKVEDGGPVFYKQERIGLYGEPFKVLKMRSMRIDADKHDAEVAAAAGVKLAATFKVKDDPRITRVGRFIRKTSIDEIPQFINVLKGDMSLVGPRPQRRYEVDQYSSLYSARLLVRPGITGPWQISGRNNLSQEDAEFLDVNYVENWSLMTDIAILIKTVGVVLRGDGAY
ncbi:sugar transferase [Bifidobacterium panos]|uniref:sugar transferase n=1 Tax=Bifidobacterium panos TaxID=2675321 RepID=UPI0020A6BF28|nr:sugar transferase [Bifidobacterium sp. DSM 109963]